MDSALVAAVETFYGYGQMQTNILIRTAHHSDAPAVCDLLRNAILQSCSEDHKNDPAILAAWLGNKNSDTVGAWLASQSNFAIVAEADREVLGIGLLTSKGKIALFYVSPKAQRAGIGKRLLSELEKQASAWKLSLLQIASTATAHQFFLKQQYSVQGEASSCFGIKTSVLGKRISSGSHSDAQQVPSRCRCSIQP